MTKRGGCLCGAVTFTAEVKKTTHGACHCGMCRRWCGGAPFFYVSTQNVVFGGEENITRYASSDWAERGSCAKCGSSLFYYFKSAAAYAMSAGAFEDPSAFTLDKEIFVDEKPEGYAFAGDHERLTAAETMAKFAPSPSAG